MLVLSSNSVPNTGVFIGTEMRLHLDASGRVRSYHNAAAFERWRPYRDGLGTVNVVGRVDLSNASESGMLVEGDGVNVVALRHYHGLRQMIRHGAKVAGQVLRLGDKESLFIGRLPEPISILLYVRSRIARASFISLVVSEPTQNFRALFPGILGRFVGWSAGKLTEACVRGSVGVIYVTRSWLQLRYPAPAGVPRLGRSNVVLPPEALLQRPRSERPRGAVLRLVTVASLENVHKGIDCLLEVVQRIADLGLDVRLVVIGSGRVLPQLVDQSRRLGLFERVNFTGHVASPQGIRDHLDEADIFVLTSRVEGLPRALVEAMARGLPAVSTRAGGVEELLDTSVLCPIDEIEVIADTIATLASNPKRMAEESARNLYTALAIAESASEERLVQFLSRFRNGEPRGSALGI